MASGEQIASLFGSLGFKVDDRGAKQFEKRIKGLEKRLKGLGEAQKGAYGKGAGGSRGAAAQTDKHTRAVTTLTSRYDKFGGALLRVKEDMRRTNQMFRQGNISATKRNELLERMTREYDRLSRAKARSAAMGERGRGRPARLGPRARGAMSGFVPGFGGAFAAMSSVRSYQQAVGMEQGLISATGSTEQAAKEMEYLERVTQRLGIYIGDAGKGFTQMAAAARGSSLEGQGVRDIFEGISSQARVLNLTAADTEGVFRAVTQIMNKKQVMAEELKNQLGERMPGAIQATARALGMLTEDGEADTQALFDAMERGELTAERVLPALAEEMRNTAETGGALDRAMKNTSASINRFRSSLFNANRTFNESGFDRAVGSLFDRMSTSIAEAEPLWILLGRSAQFFSNALQAPIELVGTLAGKLGHFTEEGYELSESAKSMAAWLTILVKPLRRAAFWFLLLPASISAVNDLLENGFETDDWRELALQLGIIAVTVGALIWKFRRFFGMLSRAPKAAKDFFGGGRSRSTTGPTSGSTRGQGPQGRSRAGGGGGSIPEWLRGGGKVGAAARLGSRFLGPVGWGVMGIELVNMLRQTDTAQSILSSINENAQAKNMSHREQLIRDQAAANFPMHMNMMRERLANLNGDITFNIESNDPERVSESVRETIDDLFRGASLQNPEVEQ